MSVPEPADGGIRKVRQRPYLNVPSATIRDGRVSFRARGILAYLLDKPDGWRVRALSIATDGTEGRDAIQTALRELAAAGYIRTTRAQSTDGRWTTYTEVSEDAIPEWATGSTAPGTRVGAPGSSGTGFPVPGNPVSGDPASGRSAAIGTTGDALQRGSDTPYRRTLPEGGTEEAQPALPGMPEPAPVDPPFTAAVVVAEFCDAYQKRHGHSAPSDIIGQIGRDAKRVIADGGIPAERILAAATACGIGGWRSLTTQLGRMSAPARRPDNHHDSPAYVPDLREGEW